MAKARVKVTGLNLRGTPRIERNGRNILAVLREGHIVEVAADGDPKWAAVTTTIDGAPFSGFVARDFIETEGVAEPAPSPPLPPLPIAQLGEGHNRARRDLSDGALAYPIGEAQADRPARDPANTVEDKLAQIAAIVDWLAVDRSARYQRRVTPWSNNRQVTFCNLYACDFGYLAKAYIPRVWWTDGAIVRLLRGEQVATTYGATVAEIQANRLFFWFPDFGVSYGWRRVADLDALQAAANDGKIGVIVAHHVDARRSGHIAIVVAETDASKARRNNGKVTIPVTSQAGASNWRRSAQGGAWWSNTAKHRDFSLWVHD